MEAKAWSRVRFKTAADDPRPVEFPPPGPYWVSGYTGEEMEISIVIAFLENEEQLSKYWPEATDADWTAVDGIYFTDRFPKPEWWN
jgi:hypothetical protein